MPSASSGWPCSSFISASSISRGTARLGTAASARASSVSAAANSRVAMAARAPSSADRPEDCGIGQRLLRELPGPAEATLQQRDHRRVLSGARALLLLPLPVPPHFLGQSERTPDDPQQDVTRDEAREHDDEQQIERELHAVGRRDEQRVARREARRQRDGDRRPGEEEEPEENAHQGPSDLARRRRSPSRRAILRKAQHAQRFEAAGKIGGLPRHRRRGELPHGRLQRLHGFRAQCRSIA